MSKHGNSIRTERGQRFSVSCLNDSRPRLRVSDLISMSFRLLPCLPPVSLLPPVGDWFTVPSPGDIAQITLPVLYSSDNNLATSSTSSYNQQRDNLSTV